MMYLTKAIAKQIQVEKHFTLFEFVNWQAGGVIGKLDYRLVNGLEYVRVIVDLVMTITSGYRIWWFNKKVGGSPVSFHLSGKAADFAMDFANWSKMVLCKIFKAAGFTNVGFYYRKDRQGKWSIVRCHVDVGKTWNGKEFNVMDNIYE